MTQEERWQKRYEEVADYIDANKRNPSKHRIEEHDMLNWLKANRKVKERRNPSRWFLETRPTATSRISQLPHQESANCHIRNQPTATFIVKKVAEFEI